MPYQLMYSSRAVERMTAASLEQILDDAREGNKARGVTGVLIYADGVFMQILEGDEGVVREVMASIERDSRHDAVKVFHESSVEKRAFGSWSMAYLTPSGEEMARWAGLEGTQSIERVLAHVHADPSRVPAVLLSIVDALASSRTV